MVLGWNGAVTDGGSDDERTRYAWSGDNAACAMGNGQLARETFMLGGAEEVNADRAAGSRKQLGQRSEIVIHEAKSQRACVDATS